MMIQYRPGASDSDDPTRWNGPSMKGTIIEETTCRLASAGLALVWLVVAGGCASGEISDGEKCSVEDDCPPEMSCVEGICTGPDAPSAADAEDGGRDVRPPEDGGVDPRDGDDGRPDAMARDVEPEPDGGELEDGGGDADTGPEGCGGACGVGEVCEDGECVTRCDPECYDDQQCTDFGEGPKCYEECSTVGSFGECSDGHRCRDVLSDENRELPVCAPSQCTSNSDCRSGTCLKLRSDYGRCVASGPKAIGKSCDLDELSERCEDGAYCIRDSSQGATGTCRKVCDPWADPSACGSDAYCGLFKQRSGGLSFISIRQGYCNPSTESERTEPFELCSADGNMCQDAVRCVGTDTSVCTKWCRPGAGDCVGTLPPRFSGSAVCNNYTFGGIRRLGRCEPECDTDGDCSGEQATCRQGLCRQTCSSQTVAEDCCNGATPCAFECNNGLCE